MCITHLNLSNLPCRHRYYTLITSCSPGASLASCSRIQVQGWEQRTDDCPICEADPTVFRLGQVRSLGSAVPTPNRSRMASAAGSRRNSLVWLEGGGSGPGTTGDDSYAERNRRLSQRIDSILPPETGEQGSTTMDTTSSSRPAVRVPTRPPAALARYRPLTDIQAPVEAQPRPVSVPVTVDVGDEKPTPGEDEERISDSSDSVSTADDRSPERNRPEKTRSRVGRKMSVGMKRFSCGLMRR